MTGVSYNMSEQRRFRPASATTSSEQNIPGSYILMGSKSFFLRVDRHCEETGEIAPH